MTDERRHMPRYRIDSRIAVGSGIGRTIDLSSRGVFFETGEPLAPGDQVAIVFPFEQTSPGASVKCTASVVRVVERGQLLGVAATYEPVAFSVPT